MQQEFFIKGMVCSRCIASIKKGAEALNLPLQQINLGKVTFSTQVTHSQQTEFINYLLSNGFEVISDRNTRMIEKVKELVSVYLQNSENRKIKLSILLSENLNLNYDSISEQFSAHEGITLERYVIHQRIEKVVELLTYTSLSLTEISYKTGFSSINHLSKQFKQITGFTPSHYRKIKSVKEHITKKLYK